MAFWFLRIIKKLLFGISNPQYTRVVISMRDTNITDTPPKKHLPPDFFTSVLESCETTWDPEEIPTYTVPYANVATSPYWNSPFTPWGVICHNCNVNVLLGDTYRFGNPYRKPCRKPIDLCETCFNEFFIVTQKNFGIFSSVVFIRRINGARTKKAIKD